MKFRQSFKWINYVNLQNPQGIMGTWFSSLHTDAKSIISFGYLAVAASHQNEEFDGIIILIIFRGIATLVQCYHFMLSQGAV